MDLSKLLIFQIVFAITISILITPTHTNCGYTVIPALGRKIKFGSLYNSRSHNFIPDGSIFKTSSSTPFPESAIQILHENQISKPSLSKIHYINSTEEKFTLTQVSPAISLAILSELITGIEGSSKFLFNIPDSDAAIEDKQQNQTKNCNGISELKDTFSVKTTGVKVTESKTVQKLLNVFNTEVLSSITLSSCHRRILDDATHFVTGVIYGARTIAKVTAYSEEALTKVKSDIGDILQNSNTNTHSTKSNAKILVKSFEDIKPLPKNNKKSSGFFSFGASGSNGHSEIQDFDEKLKATNDGNGIPISYILLPIPLLKSFLELNNLENLTLVSRASLALPKIPNAPFNFINEETSRKFFTVFDDILDTQQALNDAILHIQTTTTNLFPNGARKNDFYSAVWNLQVEFEERHTNFKSELREGLKKAAKHAENCEEIKGVDEIAKILREYTEDAYAPLKVKTALSEKLFRFQKIITKISQCKGTDEKCQKKLIECTTSFNSTQKELTEANRDLDACQKSKKVLEKQIKDLEKDLSDCDRKSKKCESDHKKTKDELKECEKERRKLEKKVEELKECCKCCNNGTLPSPGEKVPIACDDDLERLKRDTNCPEVLDCFQSGSGNHRISGPLNNTLYVAVNSGLYSSINISAVERLVCEHNINIVKDPSFAANVTYRASIVKYIVEHLAGCRTPPNAVMHSIEYFQGDAEYYNYYLSGDRNNFGCKDLETVGGRVVSLDTKESCIRLYSLPKCRGENRMFAGNRASWPHLEFTKAQSVSHCYYEFDKLHETKQKG